MWKASKYIFVSIWFLSTSVSAQFGNEWIDFTQSYYQIQVVNEDFYRVTQGELSAAGFPIATVPANRIQLFRDGQEVAINVNANGDGTLNYLEFYGLPNDGTANTELYDSGDQPHTLYNLFSDTATYFLTFKLGNENGKRITFSSDNDASGLTAQAFHQEEDVQVYFSSYASGIRFGSGASFSLSKYDDGEGWTGPFLTKNGFTDHDFVLQNFTGDQDPVCDYVLVGGNSLSHNASVGVGPDAGTASANQIKSTTFTGWGSIADSFVVPVSNLGSGGELTVRVLREGLPEVSERFSVAFMRIRYPQSISLGASENKVFTLINPTTTKAFLQVNTTNAAGTSVYDVNDPFNLVRIATTNFSDRVEAVIPGFTNDHQVLATATPASVPVIKRITFNEPELVNSNFLIFTHELLRANGDPVNDYKVYRESAAGGSHDVEIIEIDDVYNLFGYGQPTPLAIQRCIQYAASFGNLEQVFIIGRGFTVNNNYYRGPQTAVNVPTYGLPGGDLMYSLGINTTAELPGIPIGRLNAFNTDDVTAYLNKIIEMEALPFDDLWRKDFVQLSGGITQTELSSFATFISDFTDVLENDFIGGRAFNTGKRTSESVEFVDVADRINQGVGYVTFFGHSSGTVTDIEIGRVSNPEFGFQNAGRYPIFLVNGCQAGDIYANNFTFGEDWMITPNLGAIGFIAHADFASASSLKRWSDLFYGIGFANDGFIGESVGDVMLEVSAQYIAQFGNSSLSLTQIQQMLYQGDPSYKLFGGSSPDYQIDNGSVFAEGLNGAEVLATEDTFKVNIIVKNFGRSVSDSLLVQVDRTLSDGSLLSYVNRFPRTLRQDTLEFLIPNDPTRNNSGQNIFTVTLDPTNEVAELNETNNSTTIEVSIFNGNTS
ncbi:MAG: C25 family cysteine peptidase, partial [Bacteroidota bacterium]